MQLCFLDGEAGLILLSHLPRQRRDVLSLPMFSLIRQLFRCVRCVSLLHFEQNNAFGGKRLLEPLVQMAHLASYVLDTAWGRRRLIS